MLGCRHAQVSTTAFFYHSTAVWCATVLPCHALHADVPLPCILHADSVGACISAFDCVKYEVLPGEGIFTACMTRHASPITHASFTVSSPPSFVLSKNGAPLSACCCFVVWSACCSTNKDTASDGLSFMPATLDRELGFCVSAPTGAHLLAGQHERWDLIQSCAASCLSLVMVLMTSRQQAATWPNNLLLPGQVILSVAPASAWAVDRGWYLAHRHTISLAIRGCMLVRECLGCCCLMCVACSLAAVFAHALVHSCVTMMSMVTLEGQDLTCQHCVESFRAVQHAAALCPAL